MKFVVPQCSSPPGIQKYWLMMLFFNLVTPLNTFGFYGFILLYLCKVGECLFIFTKCIYACKMAKNGHLTCHRLHTESETNWATEASCSVFGQVF